MNDMEAILRMMAGAAADGKQLAAGQVFADAAREIKKIRAIMDSGAFKLEELPTPPGARGFQITAAGYNITVMQANICDPDHPDKEQGIIHRGMAVAHKPFLAIVLPPPDADYIYHKAAAKRN